MNGLLLAYKNLLGNNWQMFTYVFAPVFRFSIYSYQRFRKRKWYTKPLSLIYTFFLSVFLFVIAVELNFLWLFGTMPGISMVINPDQNIASDIYSADGVKMGKFFSENRDPVDFQEISPHVVNALIVTEDIRFYEHWGIDPKGVVGAVVSTFSGEKRGGSTITQQLAKNLYQTRRRRSNGLLGYIPGVKTIIAKSKEWITAVKLEVVYSKNDILTMYLNTVDFGHNTFGIKVAAESYFQKEPSSLTVPQAAMLIGMLKGPSLYSPLKHPDNCIKRRNEVLGKLLKHGKINKTEFEKYCLEPLGVSYKTYKYSEGIAPYFRTAVARSLEEWQNESGYNIYTDGLIIYTTLDSRMQKHAEEAVKKRMKILQKRFDDHWTGLKPWKLNATAKKPDGFLTDIVRKTEVYKKLSLQFKNDEKKIMAEMNRPKKMKIFTWSGEVEKNWSSMDSIKYYTTMLQCALMTMDARTGEVKAYVGGNNYDYFQYDHVSVAKNQPGSAFKPFVYATAIAQGWSPCDKLPDKPVVIKYTEGGEEKKWMPHNADWITTGKMMTLRQAMGKSVNTVTARLTEKVGWTNVALTARKMGIKSQLDVVPSIGLGSSEVTLYELVGAYCTFMNEGVWQEPFFVTKITDREGNIIAEFEPEKRKALSTETAWLMTHMLRGGLEEPGGTSMALWEFRFVQNNEVGGKTGTSSGYSDGTYIGITKDYVTGVWVGADDNRVRFRSSQTGEAARTALPVYGHYMELLYADKKIGLKKGKFPKPPVFLTRRYKCPTKAEPAPDPTEELKDTTAVSPQPGVVENDTLN